MKKMNKNLFVALGLATLVSACSKEQNMLNGVDKNPLAKTTWTGIDTIGGVINSGDTLKLSSDTLYYLNSKLFVKDGGVLTIQKGTTVLGIKKSTPAEATAIVITRGGKIYAQGTAQKPIIFSAATYPNAMPGDWGGVVILGNALTNQTNPAIEGITAATAPAGVDINYGGTNDLDNSGIFTYCRIQYAGALVTPDNELNGLTLGGVGAGTIINHVESIYGADDGFEWFGGRVNSTHLISYANNDDLFDFDFGFRGRLQFLVGVIAENIPGLTSGLYSANPNGIESDNNATGTAVTPYTWPVISNMTLVGAKDSTTANSLGLWFGNQWRRRTKFTVRNSVIIGYKLIANLTSDTTVAHMNKKKTNGTPDANNYDWRNNVTIGFASTFTTGAVTTQPLSNNHYISTNANLRDGASATTLLLTNPFPLDPNALPTGLEPKWSTLKTGAKFDVNLTGFQVVNFRGAISDFANNWLYESWVDFTP